MGHKREEMKECELCDRPAQMYCESDQASLCWGCDGKVHGANFLVSRHSRNLLCHVCQSLTPWHASGARLGPTVSVCKSCVGRSDRALQQQEEGSGDHEHEVDDADVEDDDYNDEMDGDDEEEEWGEEEQDEEDGENQVVPWSSTPPPVPSSSSSEDSTSRLAGGSTEAALPSKRRRENADLLFVSDVACAADEEATSLASFRATKEPKKELILSSDSRSAVIESVLRFQREKGSRDNGVLEICKLSKEPSTRSR